MQYYCLVNLEEMNRLKKAGGLSICESTPTLALSVSVTNIVESYL